MAHTTDIDRLTALFSGDNERQWLALQDLGWERDSDNPGDWFYFHRAYDWTDGQVISFETALLCEMEKYGSKAIRASIAWSSLIHEASERPEANRWIIAYQVRHYDEPIKPRKPRVFRGMYVAETEKVYSAPCVVSQYSIDTPFSGIDLWLYESDFIDLITKQRDTDGKND